MPIQTFKILKKVQRYLEPISIVKENMPEETIEKCQYETLI
jgi:hypothetical protein